MFEAREVEHLLDIGLFGAVEHRRCDRHAVPQVAAELDQFVLAERLDGLVVAVHLLEHLLERLGVALAVPGVVGIDRLADLQAEAGARPPEVSFENLPDVHPARNAERIEHDISMRSIFEERHILDRNDLRHHALVAMAAGHLVAGLNLALYRDENLDHLHHAGRELVAALQLLDLVEEALLEALLALVVLLPDRFDLRHHLVVGDGELPPLRTRILFEHRAREVRILLEALRTRDADLALEQLSEAAVDIAIEDRLLVVAVLGE